MQRPPVPCVAQTQRVGVKISMRTLTPGRFACTVSLPCLLLSSWVLCCFGLSVIHDRLGHLSRLGDEVDRQRRNFRRETRRLRRCRGKERTENI